MGAASFAEPGLAPSIPSSAAIARLRRSLSFFNSDTIATMSTIPPLIRFCFGLSLSQLGHLSSHELVMVATCEPTGLSSRLYDSHSKCGPDSDKLVHRTWQTTPDESIDSLSIPVQYSSDAPAY